MPTDKEARKLRTILSEAGKGKEADQAEINQIVSNQMSFMMPAMMFTVMINFYGAITFYYFVNNLIQIAQQKYIFDMDQKELSEIANEKTKKFSKKIQEAQVVTSSPKSSGNVRRIKAKDNRRKK
jgi:membrane protein insertase Oxa1/YidC/SpoIIIJ